MKKIRYIDILLIIACLIIAFFLLINYAQLSNSDDKYGYINFTYILFQPFILYLLIIKLILIYLKKNWIRIILNIITTIIILVYPICIMFIIVIFSSMFGSEALEPSIYEYKAVKEEYSTRFQYFPKEIPENAENYYFYIANDFHGEIPDFLEFNIDKEYIEKTIEENRDNIYEKFKYKDKYNKNYTDLQCLGDDPFNGEDEIYIFKIDDIGRYPSGMVVSKDKDKILFFYSPRNKIYIENKS